MNPKKDVTMSREMLTSVASPEEFKLARKSIDESVARMFPNHVYESEYVLEQGKLTIISFVYKYSRVRDFKNRIKSLVSQIWQTRTAS